MKQIRANKKAAHYSDSSNMDDDDIEDELSSFINSNLSEQDDSASEKAEKFHDVLLKSQISDLLGHQKRISTKANIFEHYHDLFKKKQVDFDLSELATVALRKPAAQVSVERSFSALTASKDERRMSLEGVRIDEMVLCDLNRNLFYIIDFERMLA
jgi:hypothetical protein